jgi:Ni/Co efflux regulator RcnB
MRKILIFALLAGAAASPAVAAQDQSANRQRADGVSRWTRDSVQQAGETSRFTRDPQQRPGETERWTRDRVSNSASRQNAQLGDQVEQAEQSRQGGSWKRQREKAQSQAQIRGHRKTVSWSRNWRNDARYDWRRYRDNHRSAFHLGAYYDPFGFGYRSFAIGYHLGPAYTGRQYRIDPGIYSLPFPPPGTAWVRYWDDALLVDKWTGEVIDVIHNFFW